MGKKYVLFARFWTSSQTVSTPWRKFVFNTVVEFAFYVSSGIVWEKKTLKKLILIPYPNSSERFAISGKKNSVGSSYLMSRCPEESFEENIFFPKDRSFDHFRSLTGNYFGFSAKTFHQGCQKDILPVLGNVLTNSLRKKNIYLLTIFQTLSRKMSESRQRIQQVYQNWV